VFRETVAHVVLGAVEPLIVERVETETKLAAQPSSPPSEPESKPTEQAPADAPPATHFGVALGAGPLLLSSEPAWGARIFGRADVYLATRVPSVFGLTLGGIVPVKRERGDVHSELGLSFARVQAGIEPWLSRFMRLGVLLVLGADLISATANPERLAEKVKSPVRRVDALLGALLQLRFPLWRGFELSASAGCDVDLTPRELTVSDGEHVTKLFSLARVRPYAGLAIAWSSL
jgi:hypothetical protein